MCLLKQVRGTRRSLTKTMTFAVTHFTVGFLIAYLVSGSLHIATGIALLEPLANLVAYFVHERVWEGASKCDDPVEAA